MTKSLDLKWLEVSDSVKHIRLYLRKIGKHKPMAIMGVSRGGLVPAVMLSNQLMVSNLLTVRAISYSDSKVQGNMQLILPPKEDTKEFDVEQGGGLLIVDDLVDSGNTFRALQKFWPKATYVCLLKKPDGADAAHFAPMVCPQDTWVNFPWE